MSDEQTLRVENEKLRRENAELRTRLGANVFPVRDASLATGDDDRAESRAYRDLLGAIVDCSHDAIISKDLNGTITSWNRAAEELFRYRSEEALGQNILMLFPDDRKHEEAGFIEQFKIGRKVDQLETIRLRKNGDPVQVR